jgi:hypothetical protein
MLVQCYCLLEETLDKLKPHTRGIKFFHALQIGRRAHMLSGLARESGHFVYCYVTSAARTQLWQLRCISWHTISFPINLMV